MKIDQAKHSILLFSLLLVVTLPIAAQKLSNHGMELTGSVQKIQIECFDSKPALKVHLYMQFRNGGNDSLILIRPSFLFNTKINFLANELGDSRETFVSASNLQYKPYREKPFGKASRDDYDPVGPFVYRLDVSEPPVPSTVVIDSGGYYEFLDTIWLKNGFRIDPKSEGKQKTCDSKGTPILEHQFFKVGYHLSVKKYDWGDDHFKKLQNRWKRFGHLLLDSNGDVSYQSEQILFNNGK